MNLEGSILVVDDDQEMRETICELLEFDGYDVTSATNGSEMLERMDEKIFDLIMLDLIMPGEDGISLARKIRERSDIPIIMVTGQSDHIDKVVGLEIGADDYITKPFQPRELTARVKSLLRRSSMTGSASAISDNKIAIFEGWELNLSASTLRSPDGMDVPLTTYEFQVLSEFVQRPNRVLSRDLILDNVFGGERNSFDRSVDVVVGKVRKKINDNSKTPRLIQTVRNQGYKFVADVQYR